jgi:hypothetical protein
LLVTRFIEKGHLIHRNGFGIATQALPGAS